jgi:hypothetical protein
MGGIDLRGYNYQVVRYTPNLVRDEVVETLGCWCSISGWFIRSLVHREERGNSSRHWPCMGVSAWSCNTDAEDTKMPRKGHAEEQIL